MTNVARGLMRILYNNTALVAEQKEVPLLTREGALFSLWRRYKELGTQREGERKQVFGKDRPTNLECIFKSI